MSNRNKKDRGFFGWLWYPFEIFFEVLFAILGGLFD
ncbi:hypothetical protein VPHD484_0025 [Vibrio phage D484]